MKFAFSTVACPGWDFQTVADRAKEYGYDGVEIRGFLNESILTAANVFLTDPEKVRRLFNDAGVAVCCLASSIAYTGDKGDLQRADELKKFIDTAAAIGCRLVKVFDMQMKPGRSRSVLSARLGDWLLPLGDYAAGADICIVMENALSFRAAKEIWTILDRLSHPSIAACWDVFNAALIGESPAISVPVLNSRIQYAHVKDATFGPLGASYCKLGEGDVQVQQFIKRLRGIGFDGYVTVEWEKAWLPNLAEPEVILPDSITKLRGWDEKLELSDAESAAGVK